MATINLELVPFEVPTEAVIVMPPGKPQLREDGFKTTAKPSIPLSDLSEETLSELCEEFTRAVFAAAGKTL